jgi:predicted  nucleic acid-binding Zn-ribbon protein
MSAHEEFLELAAAATSGELTQQERRKLEEHLAGCSTCREARKQFQDTILTAIPTIGARIPDPEAATEPPWSQEKAEVRLFERLDREDRERIMETPLRIQDQRHRAYFPSRVRWHLLGLSAAAMVLFALGLGVTAYRHSRRSPADARNVNSARVAALEEQLADAGHEAKALTAEVAKRDEVIAGLQREMQRESAQLRDLRAKITAATPSEEETATLLQQNNQLQQEMKVAESRYVDLQKSLDELQQKRTQESARAQELESKVAGLSETLRGKEDLVARQQEYLDHDRDIRELVGARDLYIAEIYDVERNGQTNKPYGRVFYTRGKSLVFYAYDLDQQVGLNQARAFQAWGRIGDQNQQPLNLGVFYEDSAAKKRWVMRSNDAKTLQEIDAVFVTLEPSGGSSRPSSQPLLFASLRVHPNHP